MTKNYNLKISPKPTGGGGGKCLFPKSIKNIVFCLVFLAAFSIVFTACPNPTEPLPEVTTGSISGQITVDGYGAAGFTVSVAGTSFMAITDEDGMFTISGIPAGDSYLLVVVQGNFIDFFIEPVDVVAGETTELDPKDVTFAEGFVPVEDVSLGDFVLPLGQSKTLVAEIYPLNATIQVVLWSSDNSDVASIDMISGRITARAAGTATITAVTLDGGHAATSTVTVEFQGSLLILQANTFGNANGGFPASLVELFNSTDAAINFDDGEYYLHIGTGTTNAIPVAEWRYAIRLTGTIPAGSSFLIASSTDVASQAVGPTGPRAELPTPDMSYEFAIINDHFKVALLRGQAALSVDNPSADASLADYFIDILGVGNADGETVSFTANPNLVNPPNISQTDQARPRPVRRTSLIDTDNNNADFAIYNTHRGQTHILDAQLYRFWPRNSAMGSWDPMTGLPQMHPIFDPLARLWATPNKTFLLGEEVAETDLLVQEIHPNGSRVVTNDFTFALHGDTFTVGTVPVTVTSTVDATWTASSEITVVHQLVNTGLPVIYIETQNGAPIDSRENWVSIERIRVVSDNPVHNLDRRMSGLATAPDQIRGRGNFTWTLPKRPYRIRFRENISLFGLHPARNWVLLANHHDRSLLRNTVAFELGRRFDFPFVNNAIHIDVVLNGNFIGSYVLTEHMRVGPGRVDIDATNGWHIELCARMNDDDPQFRTTGDLNLPVMIKSPDFGFRDNLLIDPGPYSFVVDSLNHFDSLLSDPNFPNNNYTDYLCIDNFVDFIMINELVFNDEIRYPLSVFMHKDVGGKIRMGHLWDFDITFGFRGSATTEPNMVQAETRWLGGRIWERFFNDPEFVSKYRNRWNEKHTDGSITGISTFIDTMQEKISISRALNAKRWGVADYDRQTDLLLEWWNRRVTFLNTEINR